MFFWVCFAALQHVSAALLHRGEAAPLPTAALLTRAEFEARSSSHPAAVAHGSMRVQRLRRRGIAGTLSAANTIMPAHVGDAAANNEVNGTSVWVVGWGRSGTTLAMDLLGATAEDVFTLYEPCHIGGSDVYRGQVITAANVQELCPLLLIDVMRCDFSQMQDMRHLKKTHEHNDGKVPEYFDPATMAQRCRSARLRIVKTVHIDESVMSTQGVRAVLQAVPRLKVVSVVRDPRAVYSSRQQCHAAWKASWTGTQRPLLNRMCAQLGQASHWPGRFPKRVHTLRYETLVAHAKDESTRVLQFLGLPVSPRVVRWLNTHMGAETCSGEDAQEYGTCRTPEQQQEALTKWRKLLPPADKAHADLVCARTLRVYAYGI